MKTLRAMATCALLASCTPSAPEGSPRAIAESVVTAMNEADIGAYLQALPTERIVQDHLDCGAARTVLDALRRTREEAPATIPLWKENGIDARLMRFADGDAELLDLSPGDTVRDCLVTQPFTVMRVPVTLRITRAGRNDTSEEIWPFWRLGDEGRWYYTRF
jgi:hypothetical protein